jgi:poly(3-hydroxybutyrate) depolymerase
MMPVVPPASRALAVAVLLVVSLARAGAQDLQRGVIIDDVKCASDPAQNYALYLPSTYSSDRQWPVLVAFRPAAG